MRWGFPAAYWARVAWTAVPLTALTLFMDFSQAPAWMSATCAAAAVAVAVVATVGAQAANSDLPPATRRGLQFVCVTTCAVAAVVAAGLVYRP